MLKNGYNLYRKQDVLEVMFLFDIFQDMTYSHSFASFETFDFLSGGIPIPNEIYVLKGKVDAMRVAFSVYLCVKE